MGEVYRARDSRLERDVALKVLPTEVSDDPERLRRFEREAKALAAVNHPNIVTVHSVEEADGVRFLTMELVEGRTLGELIPSGGLSLAAFFDLVVPLADAVAAAHDRGVVHRDLKPGNVMVTDEGRVKVLDFGLARHEVAAREEGLTALPTKTLDRLTQDGQIMGTVPYMAPEQVQGRPVTPRSDIFSLGVVLYEMATGRLPFGGDSGAELVSSILRDRPPSVSELRPELPGHLGRIVKLCLQKDPERRFQSAKDVRNELEELRGEIEQREGRAAVGGPHPAQRGPGPGPRIGWMLAAALILVVGAGVFWSRRGVQEESGRGEPLTATFSQLTQEAGRELQPTLSPDGKFVAYASDAGGRWDVYLLRVGGRNPINLTASSAADDRHPAFSPDGASIAFRSERDGGGIFVMGATGEAVRRLTDFGHNPAWSPDGTRLAVADESIDGYPYSRYTDSGLWVVDVETGEAREIFEGDAVQPAWSPGGRRIAFWGISKGTHTGQRDIWTLTADGGDLVAVTDDLHLDWSPVWSPGGGYLFFASDRGGTLNLWRLPIEEASGETTGPPEPVSAPSQWAGELSFTSDGSRMAFSSQDRRANVGRVAFDPGAGRIEGETEVVTALSLPLVDPALSPDGERFVFRTVLPQEDLYSIRVDGTDLRQITDDLHRDRGPSWSPSGEWIYFYSNRSGRYELWRIRPDGSGLEQLTRMQGRSVWFPVASPDGSRLAAFRVQGSVLVDLSDSLPVTELRELPKPSPGIAFHGNAWSPDGRLLAGVGWTGTWETVADVLLLEVGSGEFRRVASVRRDRRFEWEGPPAWLPGGEALIVSAAGTLELVGVHGGETRTLLEPKTGSQLGTPMLSPDGRVLYFLHREDEANIWLMTSGRRAGERRSE